MRPNNESEKPHLVFLDKSAWFFGKRHHRQEEPFSFGQEEVVAAEEGSLQLHVLRLPKTVSFGKPSVTVFIFFGAKKRGVIGKRRDFEK